MTPEQQNTVNKFKGGASRINTGPDGFPSPDLGIGLVTEWARQIVGFCPQGDPSRRAADAWLKLVTSCEDGTRDPAVAEEWIEALAGLL